jgi:gamma-glutamyltranspeptidase
LAAQAGLRILMAGGNAIDAAVATAATLNLIEPMMVGAGGDLFAIFYIAKEKKLYQLIRGKTQAQTPNVVPHGMKTSWSRRYLAKASSGLRHSWPLS